MLTFDDKGGGGKKTPKPAYVIHGCSPEMVVKRTFRPVENFGNPPLLHDTLINHTLHKTTFT